MLATIKLQNISSFSLYNIIALYRRRAAAFPVISPDQTSPTHYSIVTLTQRSQYLSVSLHNSKLRRKFSSTDDRCVGGDHFGCLYRTVLLYLYSTTYIRCMQPSECLLICFGTFRLDCTFQLSQANANKHRTPIVVGHFCCRISSDWIRWLGLHHLEMFVNMADFPCLVAFCRILLLWKICFSSVFEQYWTYNRLQCQKIVGYTLIASRNLIKNTQNKITTIKNTNSLSTQRSDYLKQTNSTANLFRTKCNVNLLYFYTTCQRFVPSTHNMYFIILQTSS